MSRLEKSRSNKWMTGVCGGLGKHTGIDATLIRIGFFCLVWFMGTGIMLYLILAIALPREPTTNGSFGNAIPKINCQKSNCEFVKSQQLGNPYCSGCGSRLDSVIQY